MKKERHILLVDDDADFLDTVSFWLKSKGYDIETAKSGKEALVMIEKSAPMLVFLDLSMPDMDGIQVLQEIRKTNKALPVIMVSGHCDDPMMSKASAYGISGIFPKQGAFNDLDGLLEMIIRAHK